MTEENSEQLSPEISRKRFLQRIGAVGAGAILGGALPSHAANGANASTREHETRLAQAQKPENAAASTREDANFATRAGLLEHEVNVRAFGAKGDGKTDDTRAFQTAINDANTRGGGTVYIPAGRYLIASNLDITARVTLRGVLESSNRFAARAEENAIWGSVLLAVEGAGNENGTPFLTMREDSTLRGLNILYPEQKQTIPVAYPWTVRGSGDNISILDCTFANPYNAIDFGSNICQRHLIHNLNAQAFHRGLFVDQCYDIGRVSNVHFWPFWSHSASLWNWMKENAIAFDFGRTDWQYMSNCFSIFYRIGYRFRAIGPTGPGNALLVNCGSDGSEISAQIDATQEHAGVSFVNAQMMGRVQVAPSNDGPVRFTASGFFGNGKSDSHLVNEGNGRVSIDNCHFTDWDQRELGAPAIRARGGVIGVSNCDFRGGGRNHIALEAPVRAATIVGNHFRGTQRIDNKSRGNVQIGLNSDEAPGPPIPLRTRFATNFEANQPQPATNIVEVMTRADRKSEYSLRVENGAGRNGSRGLVLRGTRAEGNQGATYYRIFAVKIPVTAKTILRYWMKPGNAQSQHSGIDLVFDGEKSMALRDLSARDSEGQMAHPAARHGVVGVWTRIETAIGRYTAGKTIVGILAANDFGAPDAFEVFFDDIEIGESID